MNIKMDVTCKKIQVITNDTYAFNLLNIKCFDIKIKNHSYKFSITNKANEVTIQVESDRYSLCEEIWQDFLSFYRFIMLFKGSFFEMRDVKFLSSISSQETLNQKIDECNKSKLNMYNTKVNYNKSYFNFSFDISENINDLFEGWLSFEKKMTIPYKVFLYSIAKTGVVVDLDFSLLLQSFQPLYKYLISTETRKNEVRSKHFREKIEMIINRYGRDIFATEIKSNNFDEILKKMIETRNMVFHGGGGEKPTLNGSECVGYSFKLYLLYRRVLLDLLKVDFKSYKKEFNTSVQEIDNRISSPS